MVERTTVARVTRVQFPSIAQREDVRKVFDKDELRLNNSSLYLNQLKT